jgi:hypothetical protein
MEVDGYVEGVGTLEMGETQEIYTGSGNWGV